MNKKTALKNLEKVLFERYGLKLGDVNNAEDFFNKDFNSIDEYCEYLEYKYDLQRIDDFLKGL